MGPETKQLADSLRFIGTRSARVLEDLTDEEFFWEPVTGCWTIRRRRPDEEPSSPTCVGRGDFVLDDADGDPDPAPFTTIAWRLGHVMLINRMFADHLLGRGELRFDDVEMPTTATAGVDAWRSSYDGYADLLSRADEATLERGIQAPWGSRQDQTLRDWTLVLLQENVHHVAEAGVVRDLFRHRD